MFHTIIGFHISNTSKHLPLPQSGRLPKSRQSRAPDSNVQNTIRREHRQRTDGTLGLKKKSRAKGEKKKNTQHENRLSHFLLRSDFYQCYLYTLPVKASQLSQKMYQKWYDNYVVLDVPSFLPAFVRGRTRRTSGARRFFSVAVNN